MNSIKHRVVMACSPASVFEALTTGEGLGRWWTRADAQPAVGGIATFAFGEQGDHLVKMEVTALESDRRVEWKCISGPWENTGEFRFKLSPDERGTVLNFEHAGWPDTADFFAHCNAKWGFFLVVSLKDYLETGTGRPHPHEPDI